LEEEGSRKLGAGAKLSTHIKREVGEGRVAGKLFPEPPGERYFWGVKGVRPKKRRKWSM